MNRSQIQLEDVLADRVSEDDLLEVPLTERVFKTFFVIAAIIGIILTAQLIDIGAGNHALYTKSARANMTEADIEQAPRGIIVDRFGTPLVENEPSFRLLINPRTLPDNLQERSRAFAQVAEIIGIPEEEIEVRVEQHDWRLGRLVLRDSLSHEHLVALSAQTIPGIDIEAGFVRTHVTPYAFSHVLGYTGLVTAEDLVHTPELSPEDVIGKTGLEFTYDNTLRGEHGQTVTVVDAAQETHETVTVKEPHIGETLHTFLDGELQEYMYTRLRDQVQQLGSSGGLGVAMNPQNGEVYALVNVPSFDVTSITEALKEPHQPLFNRVVNGLYPPASTIKPLVATAALEEDIITRENTFFSSGRLLLPNPYHPDQPSVFPDWKAHGWVDVVSSLARSSNVFFYIVGGGFEDQEGLGIERLHKWWKLFQLDEPTGIDLPHEESGFLPYPTWKEKTKKEPWRIGDTYNVSIGQGDLVVTPLELINYISAIANGGTLYTLRVANPTVSTYGDITDRIDDALPIVREGMRDAVTATYGTAHLLNTVPLDIAAKTGSAQVGQGDTNALFVGYAPVDNPELALLILIEDAKEGSLNAVPVARDIFLWYYSHRILGETTSP